MSCDEGLNYPLALCAFHRQNEELGTLKDTPTCHDGDRVGRWSRLKPEVMTQLLTLLTQTHFIKVLI